MPRASLLHHHRRQRRLHLSGLEQHDLEPGLRQASMQPLRQRSGLDPDPRHHQAVPAEEPSQRLGLTRHPGLPDNPSGPIHHAHAALFQRHVDPGIMLHGCPSRMLGADPFRTPFTSSL
jgi:hypothetical protein